MNLTSSQSTMRFKPLRIHERKARVVEMRFFGGLNSEEIAQVLSLGCYCGSRLGTTARALAAS